MTDQSSVFNKENSQETPASNPQSLETYNTLLASITNESGEQKYQSLDDALKALSHSQEYIPQVKGELAAKEQEIATLRGKLEATGSVEEMVRKLAEQNSNTTENTTPEVGLDEQAVVDLFNKFSEEKASANLRSKNLEQVDLALQQKFGDKAKEVVANKANELGLSIEKLEEMSQTSPKVVLQLFGTSSTPAPTPTQGSYNLPLGSQTSTDVPPPEKSLLRGATTKDQMDYMAKIKAAVYAKYDVK